MKVTHARLLGHTDDDHALYRLACGHDTPAPAPDLRNGDAEILPPFIDCPVCGVPRRVLAYTPELEVNCW